MEDFSGFKSREFGIAGRILISLGQWIKGSLGNSISAPFLAPRKHDFHIGFNPKSALVYLYSESLQEPVGILGNKDFYPDDDSLNIIGYYTTPDKGHEGTIGELIEQMAGETNAKNWTDNDIDFLSDAIKKELYDLKGDKIKKEFADALDHLKSLVVK